MKNIKLSYLIAGLIAVFSAVSCDYLDKQPDDQLDLETAFENRTNLERWLAYIYNGIPTFYHYDGAIAIADPPTSSSRTLIRFSTCPQRRLNG